MTGLFLNMQPYYKGDLNIFLLFSSMHFNYEQSKLLMYSENICLKLKIPLQTYSSLTFLHLSYNL